MTEITPKILKLVTDYGGQAALNTVLKTIGTSIAHDVAAEPKPIPPLKKLVKYGKTQLILDEQDEKYLLLLSKYTKRLIIAQRAIQNDTTLEDITFRLLVANYDVDTANSNANLKTYLQELVNDLALVTPEELNAVMPADETL